MGLTGLDKVDYHIHRQILLTLGSKEQIAKTITDIGMLHATLENFNTTGTIDKAQLATELATVELMVQQMRLNFDIDREVDAIRSNLFEQMAAAVGIFEGLPLEESRSKQAYKLTPDDVKSIRQAYNDHKASQSELAALYGVTPSVISDVVTGVSYRLAEGPISPKNQRSKLTAEQVLEIRERYKAGKITLAELGQEYGVNPLTINWITSGKTHRNVKGPITRKGKGSNRIVGTLIDIDTADRLKSEYANGDLSVKDLAEKYGLPVHVINRIFGERRDVEIKPVKFTKTGQVTGTILKRYVQLKGAMKGEVETFIMAHYNPDAPLKTYREKLPDYSKERNWNAQTTRACKEVLREAYEQSMGRSKQ